MDQLNAPEVTSLKSLKPNLDRCRRCDLWRNATQGVGGEGPTRALIMLVGEQPGDKEDLAGAPFVGPAGRILDQALAAAALPRNRLYITNAVSISRTSRAASSGCTGSRMPAKWKPADGGLSRNSGWSGPS